MVGVEAVHAGRMEGVLLAGIALIPLVAFELVSGLPGATQTLQRVRRAAARVQQTLDAPPPVAEPAHPVALASLGAGTCEGESPGSHAPAGLSHERHGSCDGLDWRDTHERSSPTLKARRLGCSYPGATRAALRGIDLDLSPGRRVAVVGPQRRGQVHVGGHPAAFPRLRERLGDARRDRDRAGLWRRRAAPGRAGEPGRARVRQHDRREPAPGQARARARPSWKRRLAKPGCSIG